MLTKSNIKHNHYEPFLNLECRKVFNLRWLMWCTVLRAAYLLIFSESQEEFFNGKIVTETKLGSAHQMGYVRFLLKKVRAKKDYLCFVTCLYVLGGGKSVPGGRRFFKLV